MGSDDAVVVTSLTHRYGDRVALDRLSLRVSRGTIFGLLGPNGSGKTTLFRILSTLLSPTNGSASIAGTSVTTQPHEVRRKIGVVFQHPSVDAKLTVQENLTHQGHLYGLYGSQLRRRTESLADRFHIADRLGDRVETLSGGMKRRVELAKSLIHQPDVLILDEPSTGLDPAARAGVMEHLEELRDRDGVTTLLTTHLMDEADRCDRIAVLDDGRLIATDTPTELKKTIGGDVLTIDTDDPDALAAWVRNQFDVEAALVNGHVRIEKENGHTFVPALIEAFPGRIESVTVGRPTLDDVFVHLTGHRLWNDADSNREEA